MALARLLASEAQQRRILVVAGVIVAAGVALLPIAHQPLRPLPGISTLFGALVAGADLLTFLLLANGHFARRSRTITLLACAYLLHGLFALVHVVTFPGALRAEGAIVGGPHAAGWLFLLWQLSFPLVVFAAVLAWRPNVVHQDDEVGARTFLAMVVGTVVAVGASVVIVLFVPLPAYFTGASFAGWPRVGAWFAAALCAVTAMLIWARPRGRQFLLLMVSLVLLANAIGHVVSNVGGARFTAGWYALRAFDLVASSVVLALLLTEVIRAQLALKGTVSALESRTQALHAEVQRREIAERQLVRAQRMDAVGQLAGGIGHDFNNVLHVIAMRTELAARRAPPADLVADLDVIRRSVERGQALTGQLLSLSGRRALRPAVIDVREWLPRFLDILRSVVRRGVTLEADVAPDVGAVHVDRSELETALVNLVTNARDAMPEGGTVTVVARNEISAEDGAERVVLAVRDSGPGIDAAILDRVFEPFFTTKAAGKGSGLGLSQVHGFVERSGGTVAIDSTREVGTTVTLRFPRVAGDVRATIVEAAAPARSATHAVLVVDDDAEIAAATVGLLDQLGFVAHRAPSAEAAVDLLARGAIRPRVVLSDIVMPGVLDGVALAHHVREHHPDVAVVLSTGYSASVESALADGFTVLAKPYAADQLEQALLAAVESIEAKPVVASPPSAAPQSA